ncbi:MAG: photosynthetic reaction center subunit H [Rhodospirillales bacterium]|nr:photosynthetic reaction center subunit H [Rhodospirillales bacterium]
MPRGAITSYIDVAQVVLYVFWAFFFGLIYYLRREDKREGYPLWAESGQTAPILNFPPMPPSKTFHLHDGRLAVVANGRPDTRQIRAVPVADWPGAPLTPTGNPMLDGVGPAAHAERADVVELTYEGDIKIVPLRVASDFFLEKRDPDPRGMQVVAADKQVAGTVCDVWVDRAEVLIRYLEVDVPTPDGSRRVLLPTNFSRIDARRRTVNVTSILGKHFIDVPGTKHPDQITRLEEERVCAYYAGGHLYATSQRTESLL